MLEIFDPKYQGMFADENPTREQILNFQAALGRGYKLPEPFIKEYQEESKCGADDEFVLPVSLVA